MKQTSYQQRPFKAVIQVKWLSIAAVAGLLFAILFMLSAGLHGNPASARLDQMQSGTTDNGQTSPVSLRAAAPTVSTIDGEYYGTVALDGAFTGVFSNTTAEPSSHNLGTIDLALSLTQAGQSVNGYVRLNNTLVFSQAHTIMVTPVPPTAEPQEIPLDVGPFVQGSFDGTTLHLESEPFSALMSGKTVTRQFMLTSDTIQDAGATLAGVYRETLWGFGPTPSTIVGKFALQRPVAAIVTIPTDEPTPTGGSTLNSYLPLLMND